MKEAKNVYIIQLLYATLAKSKTELRTQLTALDFTTTPEAKLGRAAGSLRDYPVNWRHKIFSIASL